MKHYLLLVDDEIVIRNGLCAMIQEHFPDEYAVLEAKDGTQALSILSNNPVDIVITDVKMPEMTGLELMHHAKEMGYHCKFAMISGYDDFELVREALVNGALDYFLKPIPTRDLIDFLKRISTQLQQSPQNDQCLEFRFSGISQPQQQNLLDQLFAAQDIDSFLTSLRESGCHGDDPCALFITTEEHPCNRKELRQRCARELEEFGILSTGDGQLISGTCRHGWAFLDISSTPARQASFLAFCRYLRAQQPKSSSQDWDSVENSFIPIIEKGIPVKDTVFDKLTKKGIYQEVECLDRDVSSVEVLVYQHNLNGNQKLGTINIPNPGGMKYKIYMQIDKKKGILVVTIYDSVHQRWIDEIPLDERQYTLK